MSIFSNLLPKIDDISNAYIKQFDDDLKITFELFEKFGREYNGKGRAREKAQKDKDAAKITLQSIDEADDEPPKQPETNRSSSSSKSGSSTERAKKRSKNEVDGLSSPEQDKRQKRNASVKAQSNISKQVNINLTQKMRREKSNDKLDKNEIRKQKTDEKENLEPNTLPVNIKQEKVSLPAEPEVMETEQLSLNIEIKSELNKDDIAMPPPAVPLPKPRKNIPKEKPAVVVSDSEDESTNKRRTRTKKTDQSVTSAPSTRSSSRVRQTETEDTIQPEPRPKRTRAKKKLSNTSTEATQSSQESATASPTEKPRPKRTRRGQKAAEKEEQKESEPIQKEITKPEAISPPIIQNNKKTTAKIPEITQNEPIISITKMTQKELNKYKAEQVLTKNPERTLTKTQSEDADETSDRKLTKTKNAERVLTKTKSAEDVLAKSKVTENYAKNKGVGEIVAKKQGVGEIVAKNQGVGEIVAKKQGVEGIVAKNDVVDNKLNETHVISNGIEMDKTMVLPNGVYNHAPNSPKNIRNMNETMVIERNDQTIILDKANVVMDATVVIDKGTKANNLTEDDSLLTDDSEDNYTPEKKIPTQQPTSAVKEKVQQFEEMASRVTRTKTRAMTKKDDEPETQTPPDKIIKNVLSTDTLTKMNSLIFNGKQPQISSSANKTQTIHKQLVTSSASKLSYTSKAKEEEMKREDARKKKEAMLEAKRDLQKRKREEKMAAVTAARLAAQLEWKLAGEAAARERQEKQHQLDMVKIAKMKYIEKKKQESARKVATTEERRKAEELSRQQRLLDEQKRAADIRRKQIEEQEAIKREAIITKEIERKQREYIEKHKKQKEDKLHTPFKVPCSPLHKGNIEPVYMQDGFQYLNSDEDADPVDRPLPDWTTNKNRKIQLIIQSAVQGCLVDKLFSVQVHSPDLTQIFPDIERSRLKRTSSAVWRTPPKLDTVLE